MRSSINNITDICTETHLSSITTRQNNGIVKGHIIIELMTGFVCPNDLVPLKQSCKDINIAYIDWVSVSNLCSILKPIITHLCSFNISS